MTVQLLGVLLGQLGRLALALLVQTAIIVGLAWLVARIIASVARRIDGRMERRELDVGRRARLRTLLYTATSTAQVIVAIIALLMILYSLGINITPVLAGVGVIGLAISLGAQALIRDFIGGFLILIENQFRVGDVIQVGAASGTVEQITLRTTHLRDVEGRLWVIPNGEVRIVSNYTRDWARAVVDVSVPQGTDIARALDALEQAMQQVGSEQAIQGDLLEAPQIEGWHSISDSGMQVRLLAKTAPGRQWDVARVMRRYATEAVRRASDGAEG